jgi:hypothetical protein
MKQINLILLSAAALCVCSCATKQTETTYWTEKSGVAVVHHIVGTVDSIEKLSEKPLTSDETAAYDLPKGNYFKVVESHVDAPAKPKASDAKAATEAKKDSDGQTLAQVTGQIQDLRREIAAVVAENKSLQDRINNAPVQQDPQPQTAQGNPDTPRLSQ